MSRGEYLLRRLGLGVLVVIGVLMVTFVVSQVVPGDPARLYLGPKARPEKLEEVRELLGLNESLPRQFVRYVVNTMRGELGLSFQTKRPILEDIKIRLPATMELVILSMFFALIVGIPVGVLGAARRGKIFDQLSRIITIGGVSIPGFWLAMILIWIFCVRLGWFPIFGEESLQVLVLPVIVIGFGGSAMISRVTRSGLLETLEQDYIRTARAKGLAERAVVIKHALKNALMPVVTIAGLDLAGLLGGTVLIETVFGRRGIGNLALRAILQRDYPLAQGLVLFVAVVYVGANLIMDFVYAYIDPRIRYE